MLPCYINITSEMKKHSVCLREVESCIVLAMQKGKLTFSSKWDSYGHILSLSSSRIISSWIIMEWFPITGVPIPVEPSSRTFRVDVEILANLWKHSFICWTVFGIFTDQVTAFVPGNPIAAFLIFLLKFSHFFDQFVVNSQVIFLAEEVGSNNNIIVFKLFSIGFIVRTDN